MSLVGRVTKSWFRSGRAAIVVLGLLLAQPASAETPVETVRRFLQLAYEGRFTELPKTPDAQTAAFEQRVRNLRRTRCVRVESVRASQASPASVDAEVLIAKDEKLQLVPLRLDVKSQDGAWLVHAVHDVHAENAARVLAGETIEPSGDLSRALHQHAVALLNGGKFEEAGRVLDVALRIARESGDRRAEALAIAASVYTTRDPRLTVQCANDALALAKELGDGDVLARVWYDFARAGGLGNWDPRQRSTTAARIDGFLTALHYAETAEDPTILVRILYSLANLFSNALSDFLTARRYSDRSVQIAREIGDRAGEMAGEIILTTIYSAQGDHERALFHHERALKIAGEQKAWAYPSLLLRSGTLLYNANRREEARAVFAKTLERNERGGHTTIDPNAGAGLRGAVITLAMMEAETGNLTEAECIITESWAEAPASCLWELAPYYMQHGLYRKALLVSFDWLADPRLYIAQKLAALTSASRAYNKLGFPDRAMALAAEAIEVSEGIEERIAGDERQRALALASMTAPYEAAAEIALDANDPAQALTFLERARARVLNDTIENGRPGAMEEASAEIEKEKERRERDVARLTLALSNAEDDAHLQNELRVARASLASFLDSVRARSERRGAARDALEWTAVRERIRRLPRNTAAVLYFVADEELHAFVMRPSGDVSRRTTKIERKALWERVDHYLNMLAARDLRVRAAARDVHDLLIAPIAADIAGAENLLVIPDGVLWSVPFAALVDRRGRYLVESHSIAYAPSVSAYAAIAESNQERNGTVSLFAVGNPVIGQAIRAASEYRDYNLGPLPDAEREVDAIARFYDRERVHIVKRDRATEALTKQVIGEADVVHFATHGVLDDANPMYSRLALTPGSATDDGWLESWEIARLDLRADVVVLSACETARGGIGGGEGVVGLTWSFFLAGAHATVATQWKVMSDTTARLMIAFHKIMRGDAGGRSFHKARALREAQLELLRDPATRHPFYWAGFVLIGDPK